MDSFQTLREQAADKRDAAIKAARAEYRANVALIDQLRAALGGEEPTYDASPRRLADIVLGAMPRDRTFTLEDVIGAIRTAEPRRRFSIGSVRTMMSDLSKAGKVRKVSRTARGIVHWAAPECDTDHGPIEALTIADAVRMVLEERGPLTATEIVVALKERGYRSESDPRVLLTSLRESFKRNRKRFVRGDDKRWSLA